MIQLIALTGISYKDFVKAGFAAFIPIAIKVIQGTQIDSVEQLDEEQYETLKIYNFYDFFGTFLSLAVGLG